MNDLQQRLNEAVRKYNKAHEKLREFESNSGSGDIEFTTEMAEAAEECMKHLDEMLNLHRQIAGR